MRKNLFAAMTLAALLVACASTKEASQEQLINGEWNIVKIDGDNVKSPQGEDVPFLGINIKGNRVYGSTSCNLLTGTLQADLKMGTIDFGAMGSTRKMCQNMETERKVLDALSRSSKFKVKGKTLTLCSPDGKDVMVLQKR